LNTELPREFEEDKKGILDIRVRTVKGKHINIEIQLLKSKYMPERTLFYWAKMYTGQIKSGDRFCFLHNQFLDYFLIFSAFSIIFFVTEVKTSLKLNILKLFE
jgi:predicted transposase/invertase (TIGR01784 family)